MAEGPPLRPFLHRPEGAPTQDTSPEELGLHEAHAESSPESPSGRVKRAVSRTANKFGIGSSRSSTPLSPSSSRSSRLLSLSRKGKEIDKDGHNSGQYACLGCCTCFGNMIYTLHPQMTISKPPQVPPVPQVALRMPPSPTNGLLTETQQLQTTLLSSGRALRLP